MMSNNNKINVTTDKLCQMDDILRQQMDQKLFIEVDENLRADSQLPKTRARKSKKGPGEHRARQNIL